MVANFRVLFVAAIPLVLPTLVLAEAKGHNYWREVKPIIDNRCVVCHSCYESPCQIKLTSAEGVLRGGSKSPVYEHERLMEAPLTRLDLDGQSLEDWREKDFFPIVSSSALPKDRSSLLLQTLQLKQRHPLPGGKILGEEFPLALARDNVCPTTDEYQDEIAEENALWGMPYGLPSLSTGEHKVIERWLSEGAEMPAPSDLSDQQQALVATWETFLNGDSLKQRLMARYIYEHLFLANIHFDNAGLAGLYRLYRSSTPPGEQVKIIATRRPYDDPGVERVYYRLLPYRETITLKNHLPYHLDDQKRKLWQALFIDASYAVAELPGYADEIKANPFYVFKAIPEDSRYRFLLDEAQFTIMNFIKGPVCRGSVSLNVIRDQFWVFFVEPESPFSRTVSDNLSKNAMALELVSTTENTLNIPFQWSKYKEKEEKVKKIRDKLLTDYVQKNRLDLSLIWDGDHSNDNVAMTILRNHDSASVEKGLLGDVPNTLWLIDYPLLERVHYLLVAGYDVYGNIGHHVLSRLHMDFLRMDGERNFLTLLPKEARAQLREYWYRDADHDTVDYLTYPKFEQINALDIEYKTQDPKTELIQQIRKRIKPALATHRNIEFHPHKDIAHHFSNLAALKGPTVALLPDVTLVHVKTETDDVQFTILKNKSHSNLDSLFNEKSRLIPEEYSITLTAGIVSAYPNALIMIEEKNVERYVDAVLRLKSAKDYSKLLDSFGVRRTDPGFWQKSDLIHRTKFQGALSDYGMLDYGRLENR